MPAGRLAPLVPALLFVSLASGCEPTCDVEALRAKFATELGPQAAATAIGESCKAAPAPLLAWLSSPEAAPPAEVDSVWRAACAAGPTLAEASGGPRLTSRHSTWTSCKLGDADLTTEAEFLHASGQPFLAVSVGAWLRSEDVDVELARAATRALLGPAALSFPEGVSPALPRLAGATPLASGAPIAVMGDQVYVEGKAVLSATALLSAEPADGSPWQVKALVEAAGPGAKEWTLAAEPTASAHGLYRLAESLSASGGSVRLLSADDDWYGTVPLQLDRTARPTVRVTKGAFTLRIGGEVTSVPRDTPLAAPLAALPEGAVVSVQFVDDEPLSSFLAILAQVPAGHTASLGPGPAPCAAAPEGMACVTGGTASLAEGEPTVDISTFYLDIAEATGQQWAACVAASSCAKVKGPADPAAPVTGITWDEADRFCTWSGKRLPTEWQWARAKTLETSGINDLAAGAPEWTDTWSASKPASCGPSCAGTDPLGPCDGATPCAGNNGKVLRGAAGEHAISAPQARSAKAGVRCATAKPWLTRFPPQLLAEAPPDPAPLSPEQLALVRGIAEDPIWEKPECEGEWGTVSLSCRDPLTYVRSNEGRSWVMSPYIRNRGGAYVGVGSDQNYTFASLARSQYVWLFDYDPDVVGLHMVNRALILASDSPKAFAARYSTAGRTESLKIIAETYADHPEKDYFLAHYRQFQPQLAVYYSWLTNPSGHEEVQWLRSAEQYAYVRKLWETGRMWPVKGDLLGSKAMQSIAETCGKLGVPMRVVYVSNAPEVWNGRLVPGYRRNITALPTDDRSIMIHSFKKETGYGGPTGPWHFNLQSLSQHQELMALPGYMYVGQLIARRARTDDIDLTLSGLRSD